MPISKAAAGFGSCLLRACLLTCVLIAPAAGTLRAQAVACPPRVALVLSGGGAKGLAHVGVLRVLDSLNIRPDLVVGTSMGSLVGAMYAGGLSGLQIDSVMRRVPLGEVFRQERRRVVSRLAGTVEPVAGLEPLLQWERHERSLALRGTVVDEAAANALITRMVLRGNLEAGGDFDRMAIPFRAIATDLRNRHTVVLGRGDVAQAVRASAAIPGVFLPVEIDDQPLIDGGITQNVPVAPTRAFGPRRIIVSDVSERPAQKVQIGSAVAVLDQLFDLMLTQPDDSLAPGDIRIHPATQRIGILDFTSESRIRAIEAGRIAAVQALAGFPAPGDTVACRAAPARPAPDSATEAEIAARLDAMQGIGAYRAIWLDPRWLGDSLALAPVGEPTPAGRISLGLGYSNQNGGHAWAGIENLDLLGDRGRLRALLWIGDLRRVLVTGLSGVRVRRPPEARRGDRELLPDPRTGRPPWGEVPGIAVRPTLVLHVQEEDLRHFDRAGNQTATTVFRDGLAFAGAEVYTAGGLYFAGGPVAQLWDGTDSTWAPPPTGRSGFGGLARLTWSMGPLRATDEFAPGDGLAAEALWLTSYRRALVSASVPARLGTLALRARVSAGWGDRLPAGQTFVLGGRDGFPGLYAGERRGQRVASLALAVTRWVEGPVYARVEGAVGSVERGGPLVPVNGWGSGVSVGGVVATPLGNVALSYGWNTFGRGAVLVQLGEP